MRTPRMTIPSCDIGGPSDQSKLTASTGPGYKMRSAARKKTLYCWDRQGATELGGFELVVAPPLREQKGLVRVRLRKKMMRGTTVAVIFGGWSIRKDTSQLVRHISVEHLHGSQQGLVN